MYVEAVLVSTKENLFWLKHVKHRNFFGFISGLYNRG